MRDIEQLVSLIIVRGREGYEATARFKNPRHDFIISHKNKERVHWLIEQKFVPRRWR